MKTEQKEKIKSEENRRCKIHKGNDEPAEFCTFCINERVSEAVIEARRVERNEMLSKIEKMFYLFYPHLNTKYKTNQKRWFLIDIKDWEELKKRVIRNDNELQ